MARQAVSMWWYLYGELLLWAQSHLAGYVFAKGNPEFVDLVNETFGTEITEDSHVLEYVGLLYSWNNVNYDDPMRDQVEKLMEKYSRVRQEGMQTDVIRRLIMELLVSRSANSSFWRFELQRALFGLNYGHVEDLVEPAPNRKQGNPVKLYYWKLLALQHVYYQLGKGLKKYRALELVADGIGQSVETIRSWEKALASEDDVVARTRAAQIAGQLEREFDRRSLAEMEQEFGTDFYRHTSDMQYAKIALRDVRSNSLEAIRAGLRRARTWKKHRVDSSPSAIEE